METVAHAQQTFEDVSPVMSAGSAAFGTLLAGRFAADEITSHGVDIVKLQEATLNLMARKSAIPISTSELQAVVTSATVSRPLRMKGPEPPKPEPKGEPPTKKDGKQ